MPDKLETLAKSQDITCYVTIMNKSNQDLFDVTYKAKHGKWNIKPESNMPAHSQQKVVLTRRKDAWIGPEGWIRYSVGEGGGGIKFDFVCSYKRDNYVRAKNDSPFTKVSFYANGKTDYDWNSKPWGQEGQYPLKSHPLSVLYVVEDKGEIQA